MEDRDDAYGDGFEHASSGNANFNPYDANEERELYDAYESGYSDGSDVS